MQSIPRRLVFHEFSTSMVFVRLILTCESTRIRRNSYLTIRTKNVPPPDPLGISTVVHLPPMIVAMTRPTHFGMSTVYGVSLTREGDRIIPRKHPEEPKIPTDDRNDPFDGVRPLRRPRDRPEVARPARHIRPGRHQSNLISQISFPTDENSGSGPRLQSRLLTRPIIVRERISFSWGSFTFHRSPSEGFHRAVAKEPIRSWVDPTRIRRR